MRTETVLYTISKDDIPRNAINMAAKKISDLEERLINKHKGSKGIRR